MMSYPNLRYIRKCVMFEHEYEICPVRVTYENVMFEHMIHMNMTCVLSELMLHTKMRYVRTYVTHENMTSCVRTYVAYENV